MIARWWRRLADLAGVAFLLWLVGAGWEGLRWLLLLDGAHGPDMAYPVRLSERVRRRLREL